MSSDEVVGSRDGCCHSTAESTVDVPLRVFRQIFSARRVLLCFIDARVRKIRNQAFNCPGIFSRTLHFYHVARSPGSPLPPLFEGHRKLVGCSAISAWSCPRPIRYPSGSIVELEVPSDETPGLMTLHPHNTNVHSQSFLYLFINYKALRILNHHTHPTDPIQDKKTNAFDTVTGALLCFIDPRVRKIRNEASSCPGIFS